MSERDDPFEPDGRPRPSHTHSSEDPDAVVGRPIGTRSFVYGTKVLATAVVALALNAATEIDLTSAFWVLLSCGVLGVLFSMIERTTSRGVEVVSNRRVNIDVVGTVLLALAIDVVVQVAQR